MHERDSSAYDLLGAFIKALEERDSACISEASLKAMASSLGVTLVKSMGERPFSSGLKELLAANHENLFQHLEYHNIGMEVCSLIVGLHNHDIETPCLAKDARLLFKGAERALGSGRLEKDKAEVVQKALLLGIEKMWHLPVQHHQVKEKVYAAMTENCLSGKTDALIQALLAAPRESSRHVEALQDAMKLARKYRLSDAKIWCMLFRQAAGTANAELHQQVWPALQECEKEGWLQAKTVERASAWISCLPVIRACCPSNLRPYAENAAAFQELLSGCSDRTVLWTAYRDLFLGVMSLDGISGNTDLIFKLYFLRKDLEKHADAKSHLQFHYAVDKQFARLLVSLDNGLESCSKVFDILMEAISAFVVDHLEQPAEAIHKDSKEKETFAGSILDIWFMIAPYIARLEASHQSLLLKQVNALLNYDELLWTHPKNIFLLLHLLSVFSTEGISIKSGTLIQNLLDGLPQKMTQHDIDAIASYKIHARKALEKMAAFDSCFEAVKQCILHKNANIILEKDIQSLLTEKILKELFCKANKEKSLLLTQEALDIMMQRLPLMREYFHEHLLELMMTAASNAIADLALVHQRLDLFDRYGKAACPAAVPAPTQKQGKKAPAPPVAKPAGPLFPLIFVGRAICRVESWHNDPAFKGIKQGAEIVKRLIEFCHEKFRACIEEMDAPDARCIELYRHMSYVGVQTENIQLMTPFEDDKKYKAWELQDRAIFAEALMLVIYGKIQTANLEEKSQASILDLMITPIRILWKKLDKNEKHYVLQGLANRLISYYTEFAFNILKNAVKAFSAGRHQ